MIEVYILIATLLVFGGILLGVIWDLCKLYKKHYELSTKVVELEYKLFVISTIQEEINGKEENEEEED